MNNQELQIAQSMNKKFALVVANLPRTEFYVMPNCHSAITTAVSELVKTIKHISEAEVPVIVEDFDNVNAKNAIFFTTIDEYPILKEWFPYEAEFVSGCDGFAVRTKDNNMYIFGSCPSGVFYGAMDMIERSAKVVWSRGKQGEEECVIKQSNIYATCNYYDKSYFEVRGWHACGEGEHGPKLSPSTMKMFGKNKINGKNELYEEEYINYGVSPAGILPYNGLLNFDDLMDSHPEYFMPDFDGKPKKNRHGDSFLNYYRDDVAELCANRFIEMLDNHPDFRNRRLKIKAPDDSHFYMVDEDGSLLHEKPFTCDDGTVVYPEEPEYQSTVYYNFVNRMVKKITSVYPNVTFFKSAYQYCELCPKIDLDPRVIVAICPLIMDMHIPLSSPNCPKGSLEVVDNIKKWVEKCDSVWIYEYWQCFKGDIYSRPNVYVVQENLKMYYKLGVKGIDPEGMIDSANACGASAHYDMNEMYYWITNKLMWNFELSISSLERQFCEIVYGKAASDMLRYYNLLEKGWNEQQGYVFWATGGDLYIKEFIINAGIAEQVKETLEKALSRDLTDIQKRKISAIKEIVFAEIDRYSKLVNEDAVFNYTSVGAEKLLSNEMLDYFNNEDSPWNKAGEIKIFKDYNTYEDYNPEAKLTVKLLYDENYLYFGFTVFDDMLANENISTMLTGTSIINRTDGTPVKSYTETYVGASVFNMTKYYGYVSGFRPKAQFYVNEGEPVNLPMTDNFKEAFYVHVGEDPKDRYYFHVQAIAFNDIGCSLETAMPFGSLVYYTNRYGRAGWKGSGLWAKHSFSSFKLNNKVCN